MIMMIKCRICDDVLEIIESINEGLFYVEPCPSCVADAVKAVEQPLALDGGGCALFVVVSKLTSSAVLSCLANPTASKANRWAEALQTR